MKTDAGIGMVPADKDCAPSAEGGSDRLAALSDDANCAPATGLRGIDPAAPIAMRDSLRVAPAPPSSRARQVRIDMAAMRARGMLTPDSEMSLLAEEFRLIKRPLLLKAFATGDKRIRNGNLIMVSSARPGDGKTFCSINLAMSIALERDLTVMLIDADVAKPSIPGTLGFEAELGLTDLITNDGLDVADVLLRTDVEKLTILPAGRPHHLATELLASDRMEGLMMEIAERYSDRVVIIDSPPALMSSVPGVIALYVGQTVFVVQAEKSTQAAIDAGLGQLSACENIYLLLNRTRTMGVEREYGAYYGYR